MQHLTCIDVNNKSITQKNIMHCNTDYKHSISFGVLMLTASPLHSLCRLLNLTQCLAKQSLEFVNAFWIKSFLDKIFQQTNYIKFISYTKHVQRNKIHLKIWNPHFAHHPK